MESLWVALNLTQPTSYFAIFNELKCECERTWCVRTRANISNRLMELWGWGLKANKLNGQLISLRCRKRRVDGLWPCNLVFAQFSPTTEIAMWRNRFSGNVMKLVCVNRVWQPYSSVPLSVLNACYIKHTYLMHFFTFTDLCFKIDKQQCTYE